MGRFILANEPGRCASAALRLCSQRIIVIQVFVGRLAHLDIYCLSSFSPHQGKSFLPLPTGSFLGRVQFDFCFRQDKMQNFYVSRQDVLELSRSWSDGGRDDAVQITFHRTTRVEDHENRLEQPLNCLDIHHSLPCEFMRCEPQIDGGRNDSEYLVALDCNPDYSLQSICLILSFCILGIKSIREGTGTNIEIRPVDLEAVAVRITCKGLQRAVKLRVKAEGVNVVRPPSISQISQENGNSSQNYFVLDGNSTELWVRGVTVQPGNPRYVRQFVVRNGKKG